MKYTTKSSRSESLENESEAEKEAEPEKEAGMGIAHPTIKRKTSSKFTYKFISEQYEPFEAEDILTSDLITFKERMTGPKRSGSDRPRLILSWDAGHSSANLRGCPNWNCQFTLDRSRLHEESPRNSANSQTQFNYNFSLGYRHDSPGASPYGYVVKLAPNSRPTGKVYNETRIREKTKAAAWFVSHCHTHSKRELLVKELQKYVDVDVYGGCGTMGCPRGGSCEQALDDVYHFYIAFENSVCTDYITEKVWNQGYGREVVPIVLKRSIVEDRLPPNSFIALDDFGSLQQLAAHMKYLMNNESAYMAYFEWRYAYKVIYLNGNDHDELERPWGFCQVCRIAAMQPRPHYLIEDFNEWWSGSCETNGALVRQMIRSSEDQPKTNRSVIHS